MLYNFPNKNFCDFKVFKDNVLPSRSYFIPFTSEKGAEEATITNKRYKSDKVTLLNGEWDFKYFNKAKDLPSKMDTESVDFDQIEVPSCWFQYKYEPPVYVNLKYPYPVRPPKVPFKKPAGKYGNDINGEVYATGKYQYNSVGVYRKFFDIDDLNKEYILSFLGVSSCLELYINGKYVGYGEGSHNTHEFLINEYINGGKNEMVCLVYKWCNGSYMEDQDMFRHNGIFRDVLLFKNDPSYIYDFDYSTGKKADGYDILINASIKNHEGALLRVQISDKNGKMIANRTANANGDFRLLLKDLKVTEWSAEIPTLYNLKLVLIKDNETKEVIIKKIGFKTVTIANSVFYLNSVNIKLLGVNHHDDNPNTGFYMTAEDIENDIRTMKTFNVNTVRTSHYPPDPMFIELCDVYGLYVIDEADIECHGTRRISKNLKWKEHFLDRVKSMFYRDRNSVSVIMWSLGNESHGPHCQEYCYKKLKELTNIPIHYEHCYWKYKFDVHSRMYASHKEMENWLIENKHNMPYFQCEYAHAMGTGPGGLEDYVDIFHKYDNCMGGCIWEFADHSVYHPDKKYKYTYGGDHGEYVHDKFFCVDGLFYPNRKPHTGALSMKNIYRPVKAKLLSNYGLIEFTNRHDFLSTEYLTIKGAVFTEGRKASTFEIDLNIPPKSTQQVNLLLNEPESDSYINIDYYDGETLVGYDQLILSTNMPKPNIADGKKLALYDNGKFINIVFDNGNLVINKETAIITEYNVDQTAYFIKKPVRLNDEGSILTNIVRSPFDNDKRIRKKWKRAGYFDYKSSAVLTNCVQDENEVHFTIESKLVAKNKMIFRIVDNYTVFANGILKVDVTFIPTQKDMPWVPKMGKTVTLNRQFDDVIYYGDGPYETYPDFKSQSRLGVYRVNVKDFLEPYIRPQESGNRSNVRYAVIRNKDGKGIMFMCDNAPFNLNAKHVTDRDLIKFTHQEDIEFDDASYISIDGFISGMGSESCGPLKPWDCYVNKPDKTYNYSFKMIPFSLVKDDNFIF